MEHFHYKIPGWFTFPNLYRFMANKYPAGSHFVEIGAWQGASTAFMAVEIINTGKDIRFDTVDAWGRYAIDGLHTPDAHLLPDDTVEKLFLDNIKPVSKNVNVVKAYSVEAAKQYSPLSLDFIFIDANHSYLAVMKDLEAWYPKLKIGGHIAGHDYFNDDGVKHAVREFFQKNDDSLYAGEECWVHFKA